MGNDIKIHAPLSTFANLLLERHPERFLKDARCAIPLLRCVAIEKIDEIRAKAADMHRLLSSRVARKLVDVSSPHTRILGRVLFVSVRDIVGKTWRGAMPRIVNKEKLLTRYDKTSAIGLKIGTLLTAAHVAALGYCITTLGSYDLTKPATARIGIFIAIFGVGLVAGIINLGALYFAKLVTYNAIYDDRDPNDEVSAGFLILSAKYSLTASFVALMVGVLAFVARYITY